MDKAPEKVTKNPKRVEAALKGRYKYMNKLKESILNDVKKCRAYTTNASNETISATNNSSNETTSAINTTISRSDDTYVYGVGILSVFAINVCVFLIFQASNKKLVNKKQDQSHNDFLCLKNLYNK